MLLTHPLFVNLTTKMPFVFTLGIMSHFFSISQWSLNIIMLEICDNAIDDDNDGLIDLNDSDCECEKTDPVSLIPNPSFEEQSCCPNTSSGLHCASAWIQASAPTTDYIHTCGYKGFPDFPPPLPFPDGEGVMGFRNGRVIDSNSPKRNYKEYAGACLLSPLLADSLYIFEFYLGFVNSTKSPPINITFFGTNDCNNLPFGEGDDSFGCPTNGTGWIEMASQIVTGESIGGWVKTTLSIRPKEDIYAIAVGPDCLFASSSISIYYYLDNLILSDFRTYEFLLEELNDPCSDEFSLGVITVMGDFSYQWYKDGIALIGETNAQLTKMYGDGSYQAKISHESGCSITKKYDYITLYLYENRDAFICKEEIYEFGDRQLNSSGTYRDTLKDENNCNVVVDLNLIVSGEALDTVTVKIFEGESIQIGVNNFEQLGDYEINLTSSKGCDSLVLLQLDYYHVFLPNVFSPNDDGINDEFTFTSKDEPIMNQHFIIFDRWGTLIHEGTVWNGTSNNEPVPSGVYVYTAAIQLENGSEQQFSGNVMLIR